MYSWTLLVSVPFLLDDIPKFFLYELTTIIFSSPNIQWVPGVLSLGVKRPGREADHTSPSISEVKNVWMYASTPSIRLHGVGLS
jgi:hypothetical protein